MSERRANVVFNGGGRQIQLLRNLGVCLALEAIEVEDFSSQERKFRQDVLRSGQFFPGHHDTLRVPAVCVTPQQVMGFSKNDRAVLFDSQVIRCEIRGHTEEIGLLVLDGEGLVLNGDFQEEIMCHIPCSEGTSDPTYQKAEEIFFVLQEDLQQLHVRHHLSLPEGMTGIVNQPIEPLAIEWPYSTQGK